MPKGIHDSKRTKRCGADTLEGNWLVEKLNERHKQSGLSMSALLRLCGLNPGTEANVSYIKSGKRGLSFSVAVRIATALNIDLRELQDIVREEFQCK